MELILSIVLYCLFNLEQMYCVLYAYNHFVCDIINL